MTKERQPAQHDFEARIPGTMKLGLISESLGMETQLLLPDTNASDFAPDRFVETSKREGATRTSTRFTELGRQIAQHNWDTIIFTAGPDASLERIRDTVSSTLNWIKERNGDSTQPAFLKQMEFSFKKRLEYMEKQQFVQEVQASNSPWTQTLAAINQRLYAQDGKPVTFAENFLLAARPIMNLRSSISEIVDSFIQEGRTAEQDKELLTAAYEQELANFITRHLEKARPAKLKAWRKQGLSHLTNNLIRRRFGKAASLESFMELGLERHLDALEKLSAIKAQDIEVIEPKKDRESVFTRAKAKLRDLFPKPSPKTRRLVASALLATGALAIGATAWLSRDRIRLPHFRETDTNRSPATQPISPDVEMALSLPKIESWSAEKPLDSLQIAPQAQDSQAQETSENLAPQSYPEPAELPVLKANEIVYAPPEGQVNPNFMLGPVSLERDFTILVPQELLNLAGLNANQAGVYNLEVDPVLEKSIPRELLDTFRDYRGRPNLAAAFRTEIERNNVIMAHDFDADGKPLPFEWIRLLTQRFKDNPEQIIGAQFLVSQEQAGRTVWTVLEIISFKEVNTQTFLDADGYYAQNPDPMFYRLDMLGLNDDQRQPGQIQLVSCSGDLNPNDPNKYSNRVILTAQIVGTEVASQPNDSDRKLASLAPETQNAQPSTLTSSAPILAESINAAAGQGIKHGQELAEFVQGQLAANGVSITQEVESALRVLANETSYRDQQCIMGDILLSALPFAGAERVADIGGWTIYDPELGRQREVRRASEYLMNQAGEYLPELVDGSSPVNTNGALRLRVYDVGGFEIGDHFVTFANPSQEEGHVGLVIDKGVAANGKAFILIFDVNFYEDGRARIVKVTDENLYQLLAGVPEGQTAKIVAIRSYESYELAKADNE